MFRAGADVIHGKLNDIHTSGHGGQEEQKLMLRLIKPKYFLPIHGEYRMLVTHSKLAVDCGVKEENCFIMDNGEVLALSPDEAKLLVKSHLEVSILTEVELVISEISFYVTAEFLSEEGLVVVVVSINMKEFKIASGPDIISRGFVYMRESSDLINDAQSLIAKHLDKVMERKTTQWSEIKNEITDTLSPFLYDKTKRRPMILPIIMEV